MGTAALIAVIAIVVIALFVFATRAGREKRREAALGLRQQAGQSEEEARRAELEAERKRELADERSARADYVDPDADDPEEAAPPRT